MLYSQGYTGRSEIEIKKSPGFRKLRSQNSEHMKILHTVSVLKKTDICFPETYDKFFLFQCIWHHVSPLSIVSF